MSPRLVTASAAGAGDLRSFLAWLDAAGELQRVAAEVNPQLEVAAIIARVVKAGGPALCFERVRGYQAPLLANLFGSARRMAWALGAESLAALADRFAARLAAAGPGDAASRLRRLLTEVRQSGGVPKDVWSGVAGSLAEIPALQSWPGDGGRYLTLPLVVTHDPATGTQNYGLYRVQLIDADTAVIHWRPASGAARHLAAWSERGLPMPVALVLGAPPALLWAATTPLAPDLDEADFATLISGAPLPLARCAQSDLLVPCAAEALIEGTVSAGETLLEGPFGNHSGHYVAAAPAPRLRVTSIRRREDMLYPCTVVGPPTMEDVYLALATVRLWLPLLQIDLPQLVDLHLPLATIFHGCTLVAVRAGALNGREFLEALWATPFFKTARLLVLVDAGTPLDDPAAVYWRVVNTIRPEVDLHLSAGRVGIVACGRDLGPAVAVAPETAKLVERRWAEYGFLAKDF